MMWSPEDQELIRRLKEYNMQLCGLTRLKDTNYTVWVKDSETKEASQDENK